MPNSQQIDGLPESVPVVLPPPDKPDAVAGIPMQRAEQREVTGQAPLANGTSVGAAPPAAAASTFSSPFADDRRSRTASTSAQRSSSGGSNSAVPNGSGAMGARALNGGSPGSAQQQPGAAGGGMPSASRKSSSYSSLPFGDPPAACVLGAAPPATMCESHACYAPRALLKGNVVQLVYLSPSYKFRWSTCGQLSSTLDRQHDAIALYMHVNVTSGTVFASR